MKTWYYYVEAKLSPDSKWSTYGHFMLAENGMFAYVGDFGNYAYKWPVAGFHQSDFRKEVLRKEGEYVLRKIFSERQKEYSPEQTLKRVKEHILTCRRDGSYSKEFAREEWDSLQLYENLDSSHNFSLWWNVTQIEDPGELFVRDYPESAKEMIEKHFPLLKAAIAKELEAEHKADSHADMVDAMALAMSSWAGAHR